MADSIVKLRVDSKDYDAKINSARQGLLAMEQACRKVGGTFEVVEKEELQFVQALGQMQTVSNTTKGKLRELTKAVEDMTLMYRSLTDAEKSSPFGIALSQSIQQMTQRAADARDAVDDIRLSIRNAASDTKGFAQISQGIGALTAGFQIAQGVAAMWGDSEKEQAEIQTKLQAAMSVTNGLVVIQTALQKESAAMALINSIKTTAAAAAQAAYAAACLDATAAQEALNVALKSNPIGLVVTAVGALVVALNIFSDKEEEIIDETEEFEKEQKKLNTTVMNAGASFYSQISVIEGLYSSYKKANTEFAKTQVLEHAKDCFNKLGIECNGVKDAQRLIIEHSADLCRMIRLQGDVAAISAIRMEQFKKSFETMMSMSHGDVGFSVSMAGASVRNIDKALNAKQSELDALEKKYAKKDKNNGGGGSKSSPTFKAEKFNLSDEFKEAEIGTTESMNTLKARMAIYQKQLQAATTKEAYEHIKKLIDLLQGQIDAHELALKYGISNEEAALRKPLEDMLNKMQKELPSMQINVEVDEASVESAAIKLKEDVDKINSVVGQVGSTVSSIESVVKAWEDADDAASVFAATIQTVTTVLNVMSSVLSIVDAIQQANNATTEAGAAAKISSAAASMADATALGADATAAGVDAGIQTADAAASSANAVAKSGEAIAGATASGAKLPFPANIAAIAAGVAAVVAVIAIIASMSSKAKSYADGGRITGGSFTGDAVPIMANAGEIVLNYAQQSNIAGALESKSEGGGGGRSTISGEQIVTVVNAYGRRTGRGEILR